MFVGINKPKGVTSHDVVDEIRRITGVKKVGHAGTLDPNATGVLVIAISREATKHISTVVAKSKEYIASIELGKTSDTDDSQGEVQVVQEVSIPSYEEVNRALDDFVGEIEQLPPRYSAIKFQGKTAYKEARRGVEVTLKSRKVLVMDIDLIRYEWPLVKLKIETGPGVYIRAIARDLGIALNTGGLLKELARTRVGDFKIDTCLSLEEFEANWENLKTSQHE